MITLDPVRPIGNAARPRLADTDPPERQAPQGFQPVLVGRLRIRLRAILADTDPTEIEAEAARLAGLTRDQLAAELLRVKITIDSANEAGRRIAPEHRLRLWTLNEECTKRGIPPIFRSLPHPSDDDPDQIADAFAADLGWLVARHPRHATKFERWQNITTPGRFHASSDWIASGYPRNAMAWLCKGLGLSIDQQREMRTIKLDRIRREFETLEAQREDIRIKIAAEYHARARDPRYRTADPLATITRRLNVWFCGSLAGWKPARTATLYESLTGERITRQLAAKLIEQVWRDVPDSRPRKR